MRRFVFKPSLDKTTCLSASISALIYDNLLPQYIANKYNKHKKNMFQENAQ